MGSRIETDALFLLSADWQPW